MLLAHLELLGFPESERKALRRPTENSLPKFAPRGADGNFGANSSCFFAVRIFEYESYVAISLNLYANNAASEIIPFLVICDSRVGLGRQRHIRFRPFPVANLRWRNWLNGLLVQRHGRRIRFCRPSITVLLPLTLARRHESHFTRAHRVRERR